MLFKNPILEPQEYSSRFGEKAFRDSCCDSRLNNTYCDKFFNGRRPSADVPMYTAPGVGIKVNVFQAWLCAHD